MLGLDRIPAPACRRASTHSRPPSRSVGRYYRPSPQQVGRRSAIIASPSHLYGEFQAPGCKTTASVVLGIGHTVSCNRNPVWTVDWDTGTVLV